MPNSQAFSLSDMMQSFSGKNYGVLCTRGTAAIYLLARQLVKPGGKVLVPTVVCPHVPVAILLAGRVPLFCDVSADHFTLDADSVLRAVSEYDGVEAVLSVETFGHPVDPAVDELAAQHDIPVVCDLAQSLVNSRPEERAATHYVYSFGHTKIPDVGAGGMIMSDDEDLVARLRTDAGSLQGLSPQLIEDMDARYREKYYSKLPGGLGGESPVDFCEMVESFRDLYLRGVRPTESEVSAALLDLDGEVEHRLALTCRLRELLQHEDIGHPQLEKDRVVWRYTFTVPQGRRNQIVRRLRDMKLHASAWYPACHSWFGSRARVAGALTFGSAFSSRVINLWVGRDVDEWYAEQAASCVLDVLSRDDLSDEDVI